MLLKRKPYINSTTSNSRFLKWLFLLTVLLTFEVGLWSQNLIVSLSIEWHEQIVDSAKNAKTNTPYLNLEYINSSDSAIYFIKMTDYRKGFPIVFSTIAGLDRYKFYERTRNHFECQTDSFDINMWGSWMITYLKKEGDIPIDFVGMQLQIMNEYYGDLFKIDEKVEYIADYKPFEIIDSLMIKEKYSDYFVFLKAHEKYTQQFNLMAFQLTKGFYRFSLPVTNCDGTIVKSSKWNDQINDVDIEYDNLPSRLNGYKLYKGPVKTNVVEMKF